ncbi:retrovirus-related pol polyprotein from transposon TNT 1-94 [Tanacetum coccineum]
MTVAGARETVGSPVVQQNGIQCFNCKGFGHYARECRKPKRVKDYAYHKEKMMMCKQAEQGVPLQAEQADWLEDTDEEIDEQELEAHYSYMAKIQEVSPEESSSTDTPLEQVQNNDEKNVFANERQHSEKHAAECADERAALANLIANLTLDTEENKTILKQLKKANASLTQELKECKTNLDESSRALGEATSSRDSSLIALQTKQTELEKYTALNDRTSDYKILQTKLNETLGLLARKDIDIQEGLKTKTYEISVVNQKHDELVKKSLLTRSQFEGQLKEKSKVISDLKVKEGKDIDTMIEMDKQIKFLNEILYKRNQSIQTIHMLAPKCATYNGRSTFANPKYLKKAQSEKPRLYEIPYDTSDPANRFCPNGEETVTLEKESRSKLDKDKVKPYDYTYQNSLYETFKPPSKTYLDQLERAKEVRKTMWRKTFVRTKPNIAKNVGFLPMSKSISKSRLLYNEMTNNFNHFRTICQQTWSNHTNSAFPNPTAKSMEVLIKILLMPLSDKTILDSHCFVHELKKEMHDDLEYVQNLEKEMDELESEKADFSNIYDLLLEECVSKDVTCSYLHSLSDLNANTELQCLYLHKVKECECLAQKLSKQTESVNKEVHNNLLKSFSKLEKHSISLELSLQHCKEQMKNNPVCKENASNVFRKEREQYHEIQDLKAQMQDKNIAISELKKLIENCKGKSVETQFNKPSVVRQPNAQRIPKPSVLGKPTPFSNSPEMRSFQTKQSVNKTNVSDGLFKQVTQQNLPQIRKQAVRNTNVIAPGPSRNCPKHVSHQSPREKVGSNDMVHNYYLEKAKKSAQLQKDKEVNGKPSMIDPARLPNTANGCKPKPRNWQASMSSRVSNKDVHLGEHRKQKPFLKFNDLQCPTCKKCLYSANHDECVLEYLSRLNPRASAQNKDAKSHKTTKRYMPVEKSSASKKPERQIPTGHRFSNKKTTTVPEKTMNPRSCLRWKPTGRIFSNVRLRWIPTGKLLNSCTGKVDSEPAHGSIVDIPHIHACKQTLGLSAGTSFNGQKQQRIDLNADALYNEKQENLRVWLMKFLISKKPVPEWPRSSMFKRRLIAADSSDPRTTMINGCLLKITLRPPILNVKRLDRSSQASSSWNDVYSISSGHPFFHQMTSDHNHSELGIQDHSNEPSSSKLVPKVVPLASKTATITQEFGITYNHHHMQC